MESLGKLSHENVVQICGMTEGPEPNGTVAWQMALEFCESDAMKLLYDKDDEVFASYGLELMVDLVFCLDVFLSCITSYWIEGRSNLEADPGKVFRTCACVCMHAYTHAYLCRQQTQECIPT